MKPSRKEQCPSREDWGRYVRQDPDIVSEDRYRMMMHVAICRPCADALQDAGEQLEADVLSFLRSGQREPAPNGSGEDPPVPVVVRRSRRAWQPLAAAAVVLVVAALAFYAYQVSTAPTAWDELVSASSRGVVDQQGGLILLTTEGELRAYLDRRSEIRQNARHPSTTRDRLVAEIVAVLQTRSAVAPSWSEAQVGSAVAYGEDEGANKPFNHCLDLGGCIEHDLRAWISHLE